MLTYIHFYTVSITTKKQTNICTCPVLKPWLTCEVHQLLKAQDAAFKYGHSEAYKTARVNINRSIKTAKLNDTTMIEDQFSNNVDPQPLWQVFKP